MKLAPPLLLLGLVACRAPESAPAPASKPASCEVQVVAHADDDLLFMNPDVATAARREKCTTTIVLTAGDAGHDATYWSAREEGLREAYAEMVGVANAWEPRGRGVALRDAPGVALVFLRLPDGNVGGGGFEATANVSLERMWKEPSLRVPTVDGAASYTKDELVRAVAELVGPARLVRTLDGSGRHEGRWSIETDHSDHAASARFGAAAAERRGVATRAYRGYDISREAPNLTAEEAALKRRLFLTYARHDEGICSPTKECRPHAIYEAWIPRRFTVTPAP